ncbi:MAG: metallophosphoesterase [Pyrinomonadaceae bacterium]|nr:metallophosphoesterase [Pyrinomonadaceae bacterium]
MAASRKLNKKLIVLLALLLSGVALAAWAFLIEPSLITVSHHTIKIPRWQREHQNLKIAILTDLHVGAPHMNVGKLKQVVERTNAEAPDAIVILGDLVIQDVVGGKFVEPELIANELKNLRAPLGVVAVLGNHDWWLDGERVARSLRETGLTVLENDVARVERDGKVFWFAGLGDLWTRAADIKGTLGKIQTDDPVIVLTHNPDVFPDVPARVSLTLAGHTHGGQVNLPFVGRPIVPSKFGQRYASGHITENGRHLFVTNGIGTSIIPVRFRVPPEIVVLTLQTEDEKNGAPR